MHTIENTLFTGKVLHQFDALDSTNDYAAEWLRSHSPINGMVISTYNQRKGKGQIGNSWWTEPQQNIALSIIYLPSFLAAKDQFLLNQAVSLGVYDMVEACVGANVKVKWPNDIYVANQKVGGILIQNAISSARIQTSVIGIGLNVNQPTFPTELPNPGSLYQASGKSFDLDNARDLLCEKVEAWYLQLQQGKIETLRMTYLDRLFRFGEPNQFCRADGTLFQGIICGVQPSGKLMVQTTAGEEYFDLKAIRFVID